VFLGELDQLGQTGHRAVVVHDFADDRGGLQASHAGQVATGFGVAGTNQHAAFAGGDRENVAGLHDVVGNGVLGHGHLNGPGAVGGGNAGGDALGGFDRDGEGCAIDGAVVACHLGQAQALAAFGGQGQADQATAVLGHEIDGFRRDVFGGHDEVALVFAVFFIDQHDHAAGFEFGDDFGGAGNGGMGGHGGVREQQRGCYFRRNSALAHDFSDRGACPLG